MSVFSIKGLSPEAWYVYKWEFQDEFFHKIILKEDEKKANGHYERGEAYILDGKSERPLTAMEQKRFEDEVKEFVPTPPLENAGKVLKVVLEGKCLHQGYKYFSWITTFEDCTPREIIDAAEDLINLIRYPAYESGPNLALPLKSASDKHPTNPDIALAAGIALFNQGKYAESIPYFTRANAYVNDSTALDYLVKVAFEVGDWARFTDLVKNRKIDISHYVFKKGGQASADQNLALLLKAAYALSIIPELPASDFDSSWFSQLANDPSVAQMLEKYPKDFGATILANRSKKDQPLVQRKPAPAKPASKQAQSAASDDYLFK